MELFDGRRIVGSIFGGFKGRTHLPLFAKQCLQGAVRFIIQTHTLRQEVKLDEFITHELPFDEIHEAFDLLVSGKSLRCLLHL
ncbi:hypothetical protein K1719_034219 [Acacia pycnantha]|nr:hypothetical protein K1719_034219 [Acacia pycnantha]